MTTLAKTFLLLIGSALLAGAGAQTVVLTPRALGFAAVVGGPNPPALAVAITRSGAGSLAWKVVGPLPAWLAASPPSGAPPESLAVSARSAGLSAGIYYASVPLSTSAAAAPTDTIPVVLVVAPRSPVPPALQSAPGLAEYEVEFRFKGYSGLVDGYPDCKVNPHGFELLSGTVLGVETPERDEDVEYYGTLKRVTAVDFCETKGRKRPGDDERIWCAVRLTGSANMNVQFTVYGEQGRGGYLKADPDSVAPAAAHQVAGDCDAAETNDVRQGYPSGDGGGSPNGQAITDRLATVKLFAGGLARLRVGVYPNDPKESSWSLRVVRKIR